MPGKYGESVLYRSLPGITDLELYRSFPRTSNIIFSTKSVNMKI